MSKKNGTTRIARVIRFVECDDTDLARRTAATMPCVSSIREYGGDVYIETTVGPAMIDSGTELFCHVGDKIVVRRVGNEWRAGHVAERRA